MQCNVDSRPLIDKVQSMLVDDNNINLSTTYQHNNYRSDRKIKTTMS